MLKNEPNKAFYGPKHVALAVESEAVETLLICDKLFRARGVAERRKYVEMVDKVTGVFAQFLGSTSFGFISILCELFFAQGEGGGRRGEGLLQPPCVWGAAGATFWTVRNS